MAAPNDPSQLNAARAALPALRASLLGALYDAAVAEQALTDARRKKTDTSTEETDAANADSALTAARTAFDDGVQAVNDAIAAWFVDTTTNQPNSVLPADDIGRMLALNPIVFFPIRIETRFEGASLKLRVYPDEIFFNSHETALTPDEQAAARNYYTNLNKSGVTTDEGQKADWRDLVKEFGAQRAAYILRAMLPNEFVETGPRTTDTPTVPVGQGIPLTFPSVTLRPRAFTRPAEAVLPDRWVVMTRNGNTRKFFYGSLIREPMFVTVDPAPGAAQSTLPNGYTVDDRTRWTIDFDAAVALGMALTIPLVGIEPTLGFDRVVVFGVKSSLPPDKTADALAQLIDAHHYTRGIAFMRQESATNNTQDRRTTVPLADDAGAASFAIERAIPPLSRDSWRDQLLPNNFHEELVDGNYWAYYLGLPSGVLQQVERSLEIEIPRARAMNRALWPVTFGSFLKFMMDPVITQDGLDKAKTFFLGGNEIEFNGSTARGVAPVLRIGQVPYGLLPVASLLGWHVRNDLGESADAQTVQTKLLQPLKRLVQIWKTASSGVKRLKAQSSNPDIDLLSTLALYPTSRDVRLRTGYGFNFLYDIFNILSWDIVPGAAAFDRASADLFQRLGHPEWRPRIGRTMFFEDSLFVTTPFVDVDKNLSEDQPLASDYLTGLATAAPGELLTNAVPSRPSPDSLLYELLRISTLTEYALELDQALKKSTPGYSPWVNGEVFGLAGLPSTSIMLLMFDPVSVALARSSSSLHLAALGTLIGTPTAELDRLTRETLDLASHRLDVWVTAFALHRLAAMRSVEAGATSRLGGYGWVEDLRPQTRATAPAPDGNLAEVDSTNGGFVHSPSSQHGMAAAVLRNGFLSYSREDPQKYAFDLSSRQVRTGVQVLQEVAAGRHLGEVLGYRFERALQGVPSLNAFRFAFRTAFPLVAGKDGVDTAAPPDRAAAPNVVDGLALYRAYKAGTITFAPPLPTQGTAAYTAVIAELNNLGQMLDAVADVMVAEGVYQLAGANLTGAAASLDNLVRGGHPPEPGIAQSPRAGRGLTHRIVYLFQKGSLPALPAHWDVPSARALAEPVLNAWVGSLIGDPQNVTATVKYKDATGPQSTTVNLQQLQIQPLDLLALVRSSLQPNQASLLEQRIQAVIADVAGNTGVTVDYAPDPGRTVTTNRTFPEIVELLVTLGATLGGSRALGVEDLLAPSDLTETLPLVEPAAQMDANELLGRAGLANATLVLVVQNLDTRLTGLQQNPSDTSARDNLRLAIRACGSYAPERAWANATDTAAALTDNATALLKELKGRLDAVTAATPSSGASSTEILQGATAMLQAIFGTDMFLLPQVTPPRPDELTKSLGARSTLLGSDDAVLPQFVQQAMHGRTQLARYRKFSLYARALGSPAPGLSLVQLPYVPGEQWLGRPFPPNFEPDASRMSIILLSQASPVDPTQPSWWGFVVESFTEVIPSPKQQTSVAFNYNGPRAEAPQSILVMAPSGPRPAVGNPWDINDIAASLEETLDLAKVRAVDRELLGDLAQLIPGIVIPNNADPNITTSSGAIAALAHLTAAAKVGFQ